eukprot:UN00479
MLRLHPLSRLKKSKYRFLLNYNRTRTM